MFTPFVHVVYVHGGRQVNDGVAFHANTFA